MDGKFSDIVKPVGYWIEKMTTDPNTIGKHASGHVRDALDSYETAVTEHDGAQEREWGESEVEGIRSTCDLFEEGQRTEKRAEDLAYIRNRWVSLWWTARKLDHDVQAQGQ